MKRGSALLLAALGCARTSAPPPPPSLVSVDPARGYASRDTPVLLRGDGFIPAVVQQIGSGSHLALKEGFRASVADVELDAVRWVDSRTLAAIVPASVPAGVHAASVTGPYGSASADAVFESVDAAPAALAATVSAPPRALVGADVVVTVIVSNTGAMQALGVAAGVGATSGPAASLQAPSEAVDIAGGGSYTFTWHVVAAGPGLLTLDLPFAGSDEVDGSAVAVRAAASILVGAPAHLVATALQSPSSQPAGPTFQISVDVTNDGGSDALGVRFDPLSGSTIVSVVDPPDVTDVPAGATRTFVWDVRGTAGGTATVGTSASGTDEAGGGPVGVGPLQWTVSIFQAALLEAAFSVPPGALPGETFTVSFAVSNPGIVDALALQPSITASGTGAANQLSAPAPADVPAGQTVVFQWTYAAAGSGTVQFAAGATGTDASSGNPVSASATGTIEIGDAVPVAVDPFGDGAPFASVFAYAGRIYLGPSADGSIARRMRFDGTGAETVRFAFQTDFGNIINAVSPTPTAFPTLGSTGCAPDTLECGPDNEDGRGLFTSFSVAGQEWLYAAGGRHTNILEHFYLSTDTGLTPQFPSVRLNVGGGNGTATGVAGLGSAMYLAFADSGSSGTPVLLKISGLPASSTQPLNPTIDMVHLPPTLRSRVAGLIDSMLEFGGWLYAANDGGCERYDGAVWATCTPSAPAWVMKESIGTTKAADFVPADKAVPQMTAFAGKLYLARNTTTGPQLWACTPVSAVCSAGDWSLIAANGTGDVQLSQMNDPGLTTVSLLAASSQHLYVGYDSGSGVRLFRSPATAPVTVADFTAVGSPGLGANLTAIVDGRALSVAGKEFLYVAARPASGAVRIHRLSP